MADEDIAAIRAKRMAELQGRGGAMGGGAGGDQQKQMEDKQRAMEDMRNSILSQVLSQEARARLNTLTLAKPEKGRQAEAMLLQMAQTGQISNRMSEDDLVDFLQRFGASGSSSSKVKFDRRRAALDDDDDY